MEKTEALKQTFDNSNAIPQQRRVCEIPGLGTFDLKRIAGIIPDSQHGIRIIFTNSVADEYFEFTSKRANEDLLKKVNQLIEAWKKYRNQ